MTEPRADVARIAAILRAHEYAFGHDTNCLCGAPGIWTWDDYRAHVAEAALAPDVDVLAQEIWQAYVVETGRALPEGLADKLASAAVAAMGFTTEELK